MKCILFLLVAVMCGAVRGHNVGAEVQGQKDGADCSEGDQEFLYQKCVLEVAEPFLFRRLELRGSRDLQATGTCGGCADCDGCYPPGHFCYTWCPQRRLTLTDITDEAVHIAKGKIQQGANDCLDDMIDDGSTTCLGKKQDLKIKIFLF
jgi:hypothetical protein